MFSLTFLIGTIAAFADQFAAACIHRPFGGIKWQRQTADRTFAMMAPIWLRKQIIITYFSSPSFTSLLVLRPMIFLTVNATVSE
jgi:hypothetical protein